MTTLALSRPSSSRSGLTSTVRRSLARPGAALAGAFARWWDRRTTTEALAQLDARTLADIGLSRDDLPGTAAALARDVAMQLSLR